MRSPARELTFVQNLLHKACQITIALFVLVVVCGVMATPSFAQETTTSSTNPPSPAQLQQFIAPRVDENVPKNLSTLSQSIMMEVLATVVCQIAGIDPINPKQPCLGINPQTRQLGYAPHSGTEEIQVGGLLGMAPALISGLYTPSISTNDYTRYIGQGFGIAKPAYAESDIDGFQALTPVLQLWKTVRNVAYMFLIIAFIFIGLGVMLRIKIDPRTVMTIQNQVPRIVICILLITFSYPLAGLMVDAMWLTTYAGINILTSQTTNGVNPSMGNELGKLSKEATSKILQTPLAYINAVQTPRSNTPLWQDWNAYEYITLSVSIGIGDYFKDIVKHIFNTGNDEDGCNINPFSDNGSFTECVAIALGYTAKYVVAILVSVVVFCVLLVTLFKIWFMLLKAYVWVILYVIGAPIWIVFGLLPGRPLGFEKWMRSLFANLAVFPLTAFLFVGGRVMVELFDKPTTQFVAPLTGNPNMPNFGILIAFGMLLMGPKILTMLQESMKATGSKHGSAIGAAIASGAAAPAAFANKRWEHLNRINPQTLEAHGMVARFKQDTGTKMLKGASKLKIPMAKGALANKEWLRAYRGSFTTNEGKQTTQNDRNKWHAAQQAKEKEEKGTGTGTRWMDKIRRKNNPPEPPTEQPPIVPPTVGPKPTQGGGGAAHAPDAEQHQGEHAGTQPTRQDGPKTPEDLSVGVLTAGKLVVSDDKNKEHGDKESTPTTGPIMHGGAPISGDSAKFKEWYEKKKQGGEMTGKTTEEALKEFLKELKKEEGGHKE